jgi:outer membrane PBP1 activator LpoA protein
MAVAVSAMGGLAHSSEPSIGVIVPLTGPLAIYGSQVVSGIRAGAASVSQKPSLAIMDDAGSLPNTVSSFRRLVEGDRVALITGFTTAGAVAAVSAVARANSPPVIHLSPFYEPRPVNPPDNLTFGLVPSANSIVNAAAEFARDNLGIKSATIVFGISQQYETLAQRLYEALKKVGIEDVKMQRFSPSDDPTRLAAVVRSSDVIVLGPTFIPSQLIQSRIIVVDPMPTSDSLSHSSGFLISAPQAKLSVGQSIVLDDPEQFVGLRAYGFALAEIASQAIAKANRDPQLIFAALREQNFQTAFFGQVKLSQKTGFSNLKPVLFRYEGGRLTLVAACSKSCPD